MDTLHTDRLAEGLREHARGLAAAAAGRGPSARVPTCPEWTMRDLVGHVGQGHRWAAGLIRTGGTDVVDELPRTAPDSPADWPDWLGGGADDLVAAFTANPDGTVTHPILGTHPTAMWLRRMAHETSVHHADAALAAGAPFAVAPDLAADAISEFLGLLANAATALYKPEMAELRGNGETILVAPAEADLPGWLITRAPDGLACGAPAGAAEADVTLAGAVRDLLLVLARRLDPERAEVTVAGDRSVLDHWIAHTSV